MKSIKAAAHSILAGLLLLAGVATSLPALADSGSASMLPTARPVFGFGLTGGGDAVLSQPVQYSDGTTDQLYAGSGIHIFGGIEYQAVQGLFWRTTLGYHFDSTAPATNGEISFSRFPLELTLHTYIAPDLTIGGGLRKSLGVSVTGTGAVSDVNYSMDSNTGWLIQGEYELNSDISLALRLVRETYRVRSTLLDLDAGHVGAYLNFVF
jgi:hypothetical protein